MGLLQKWEFWFICHFALDYYSCSLSSTLVQVHFFLFVMYLSFGCSTFDANRRIRDSSLLHGSWLKNFSASSSACYSAGAAHAVSFDGSPPDEQLANSSFSPDPYVIVVLNILNSISP